ncbi:MAG: hypothetical protein IPM48_00210 [Saprospiraceae bacterium]|nr:hypothetical protein [Saprospiraceae bacterium]
MYEIILTPFSMLRTLALSSRSLIILSRHFICLLWFGSLTAMLLPVRAQKIALGGRHSIWICPDKTVRTWGYNGYGQLGYSHFAAANKPTAISGLNNVSHIAGGLFHSLFVKSDGTVYSCGRNALGPLGIGNQIDQSIPVQIEVLSDIVLAAGGSEHSLFLRKDGKVFATGSNSAGQLGDGTRTHKISPVMLPIQDSIIDIAAGAEFSLFLRADGRVLACGHNGFGQFGNGNKTSSNTPIIITGISNIKDISAGEWHSLFVNGEGEVFSSGRNQYGQLGLGHTTEQNTALKIEGLYDIIQAEAGGIHSLFVNKDGMVWACGLNSGGNNDGQLGDNTRQDRLSPVQVVPSWGSIKVIAAEAAREHSIFLLENGEVWACGRNNYGQLGNDWYSSSNALSPVQTVPTCADLTHDKSYISDESQTIHVFPVPTSGPLTIDIPNYDNVHDQIVFYNMQGLRLEIPPASRTMQYLQYDLTALAPGIYFFEFNHQNSKFIIRKFFIVI